ncbi:zinc finger protein 573 isoform X7 [Manduca sexta]|uniref:zinc finger protein 573 isoform X7 n=1 Tax=Manduca sexta TaxID=7130 RepID=UPI00188E16F2|nr:zinc finger protein 573 isoform X7 [Manduca sexta]
MDGKTSDWRPGPSVCRCCLAEGCYKDISTEYFWMGKREVYADMLSDTFSVSIAYSSAGGPNSHSRLICEPCISRLRDAADFKRQVQECERTFMQHLDPGSTSAANDIDIEAQPAGKEVKLEQVKLEKRFSDDDFDTADFGDEDDDDMDDQPLTKFATKVPKKEAVDFLDLIDNSQITVKRMSMSKSKAPPAKKVKVTKKEPAKPTASKAPIKVVKEKKKKDNEPAKLLNSTEPRTHTTDEEANFTRLVKQDVELYNAIILLRHTTAYPLKFSNGYYRCYFCSNQYNDPNLYRLHIDSNHNEVDKAKIINLNQTHNQIRVDITGLRCKDCAEPFVTLDAVGRHLANEHQLCFKVGESLGLVPMKLRKDNYACLICDKKFTGYKALSVHSGSHYFRIICDVCGKKFENVSSVRTHMYRTHSVACSKCKVPFSSVEARKDHVRSNEACFPFRCTVCKQRFLFWERRQEHLEIVHGQPKKEFPCAECDKIFKKRTLLYLHFKATHTDDHRCKECNKRFSTKRHLREHLSIHLGQRPLECSVCQKTFSRHRSLRKHLSIHNNSKKFVCQTCTKLFVEKKKLALHIQKCHPETVNQEYTTGID